VLRCRSWRTGGTVALHVQARHGGIEEAQVEAAVVADQDRPLAAIGLECLAHATEDVGQRVSSLTAMRRVVELDPGEFQGGLLDVGAFERLDPEEVGVLGEQEPFSSMPMVTAAISSRASVALLKPPVSTSTTTGR
jgi:hypothetical protein